MTLGRRIYNSSGAFTAAVTVLGAVLALVLWLVPASTQVSIAWPLAEGLVLLSVICLLTAMLLAAVYESEMPLPRVLRCLEQDTANIPSGRLLLVQPSRLLGVRMAVSIYSVRDQFEILIGDGVVLNVQQNQKIQVAVTGATEGTEELWSKVVSNQPDALGATLIRPGNQYRGLEV